MSCRNLMEIMFQISDNSENARELIGADELRPLLDAYGQEYHGVRHMLYLCISLKKNKITTKNERDCTLRALQSTRGHVYQQQKRHT